MTPHEVTPAIPKALVANVEVLIDRKHNIRRGICLIAALALVSLERIRTLADTLPFRFLEGKLAGPFPEDKLSARPKGA